MPFNPDGQKDMAEREAWEREQADKKNKQNKLDQEVKEFEENLPKAAQKVADAVNEKYNNEDEEKLEAA